MQTWQKSLLEGQVIPACPLALTEEGDWSPKYQRALLRYYLASGAGGIAVGVHTTQFEIRQHGLYEPILRCVSEILDQENPEPLNFVRVAGLCGNLHEVIEQAELAKKLGYHLGLLSPSGFHGLSESEVLQHTKEAAEILPVFGFFLHEAVGGSAFSFDYWCQLAEIKNVQAIKIAAFNRYQTLEVMRAIEQSGRDDLAVYTGNDDNIILDLLTPYQFSQTQTPRWMAGGLLGQWAVWTRQAVEMLESIKLARSEKQIDREWLLHNVTLTDANSAIFDARNQFAGCIAGVNEVLRRQGLLPSSRCLSRKDVLSPGQSLELDRVAPAHIAESEWIRANLADWLK